MSEAERLKLAKLVSDRVCQSLIGPLGAVANGIELLRSTPDGVETVATQTRLDRDCTRILDRLMFFRLAYGSDDDEIPVSLHELQAMATAFFAESRLELNWPLAPGAGPIAVDRNAARVLLNGLLVVAECLGMRGTIAVRSVGKDPSAPSEFQVIGAGDLLPLSAAKCRTLQNDIRVAYLDEHTIHPYLAGQLARHSGIGFSVAVNPHRIEATILLPRPEPADQLPSDAPAPSPEA
jgi:histidine phosphotransferase ChpT